MKTLLLIGVLVAAFEVLWVSHPALLARRSHFRAMTLMFWALTFVIWAGNAWGLLPTALYYNDVPRFASDAVTYQHQALYVADGLRQGTTAALADQQVFNYSRLLGVIFYAFDNSRLAAGAFNAVFFLASVVSVFFIGRRLFGEREALYAAWLAACWPIFLLYETQTLRWVSTTAGLHLLILGTVMVMGRGRVFVPALFGFLGYVILLLDMPQFARLAYVVASVQAVVLLVADLKERSRPVRALRVVVAVIVMAAAYDFIWVRSHLPWLPAEAPQLQSTVPQVPPTAAVPSGLPPDGSPRQKYRYVELPLPEGSSFDAFLNRLVRPILETRLGYLKQNEELKQDGISVGTMLVAAPLFNWQDFAANVPNAVFTATVVPTPMSLVGSRGGASAAGPVVAIEVIVYYALLGLMVAGLVRSLRKGGDSMLVSLYLLMFTVAAYIIIGTVTMNGGTLHRFRLPYVVMHMVYAAPLLAAWLPGIVQRRAALRS